jgi:outer membrane lipoprotein SlyB
MKSLLLAVLASSVMVPARAQLFGPESLGGALLGGIAGGVIGHNNGRHTGEGIAIGAGVGAVLGAIIGNERRAEEGLPQTAVARYPAPPHAVSGLVLGGIAGGIIGHNNGRHTAEGVAIGAGAGLLLGTLADQSVRSAYPSPPRPYWRPVRTVDVVVSQEVTTPSTSVSEAPVAPAAPLAYPAPLFGGMAPANALFGR